VVDFAGGTTARDLTAQLRATGLRVDRSFDGRSPKAQFKAADRSGARLAIIIGPDEAATGTAGIKDLLDGGDQITVAQADLVAEIHRRLKGAVRDNR
jgi:histidyl-tRNA synthetase